ncbi:MAG: hypothetical protein ACOYU7_08455 [Bacillota bacterium]
MVEVFRAERILGRKNTGAFAGGPDPGVSYTAKSVYSRQSSFRFSTAIILLPHKITP